MSSAPSAGRCSVSNAGRKPTRQPLANGSQCGEPSAQTKARRPTGFSSTRKLAQSAPPASRRTRAATTCSAKCASSTFAGCAWAPGRTTATLLADTTIATGSRPRKRPWPKTTRLARPAASLSATCTITSASPPTKTLASSRQASGRWRRPAWSKCRPRTLLAGSMSSSSSRPWSSSLTAAACSRTPTSTRTISPTARKRTFSSTSKMCSCATRRS
mmetsp:Transcript_11542/g.29235  ORF Transcript_11542/g.29235 Transcript_11542/m.29235 type:complete len:216 (-) Transcript_11542:158-805(-)